MQKTTFILICMILLSNIFTSCSNEDNYVNSTGKSYEIVVVSDLDSYKNKYYPILNQELRREMLALPQAEPEFTLVNMDEDAFDRLLKTHHNVMLIKVDKEVDKPIIKTRDNVWAYPQRVVSFILPENISFDSVFPSYASNIRQLFNENEEIRFKNIQLKDLNIANKNRVLDSLNVDISFPNDFYIAKLNNEFSWIRHETSEISLGLLIYTFPYENESQVSVENILAKRNEFTKKYIPGSIDGSYMTTDEASYTPDVEYIEIDKKYTVEVKGLWRTYGDFMGGPFVNYTIVDVDNSRIVCVDGFVYNPKGEKRIYIRNLQAIAKTLKIPKKVQKAE